MYASRAVIQQWCIIFSLYTVWMPGALFGEQACLSCSWCACCDMHVPPHLQMHTHQDRCYHVRSLLPVGLFGGLSSLLLGYTLQLWHVARILVMATFDCLLYCLILVHVVLVFNFPPCCSCARSLSPAYCWLLCCSPSSTNLGSTHQAS